MAPWLRSTRLTGLVPVTGLLVVLVAGAAPSVHAAEPSPANSRAGSRAGEGRERPGRQEAWPAAPDDTYAPSEDPVPEPDGPGTGTSTGPDTAPPPPAAPPGADNATAEEPVLRVMALGSGLILMGAGLGLAFVGLRIRRY
ncbi:hypothetical protein ACFY4I_01530 [Streptomyces scabiei]|uniref:hypothetical protein n=1 Tax=Streptomyces scabiei TaxID=1930 RepID=UPI0036C305B3